MEMTKINIAPSYKKDNGLWVLHIDSSLLPTDFRLVEQSLVSIPPQQAGGNHKHPREEAFLATSNDLILYWINKSGEKQREVMLQGDRLTLFIMASYVPHAVFNKSTASSALLYEFANDKQHDLEMVSIV